MLRLALTVEQLGRSLIREVKLPPVLNFARHLSQIVQSNTIDADNNDNAQKTISRKQLINYINKVNPDLLTYKVKSCLKLSKARPSHLWLIDAAAAQHFFSLIIDDLLKNTSVVIQINAGPGLLTELLIKAGIKPLYILDREPSFRDSLSSLVDKYNDPVTNNISLSQSPSVHKLLRFLEPKVQWREWHEESSLQVIVAVACASSLAEIIRDVVNHIGYAKFGRPTFYCAIYPSVWQKFINMETKVFKWTTTRVFMCNFFNTKILGTVPRQAFLPWEEFKRYPPGIRSLTKNDWDIMYIMKIEPKPDLFTSIDKEMLPVFFKFVRGLTWGKNPMLIPKIESYFPGYGLSLIQRNFDVTTSVKQLTYNDFLTIFEELEAWPNFEQTIMNYDQSHRVSCDTVSETDEADESDEPEASSSSDEE